MPTIADMMAGILELGTNLSAAPIRADEFIPHLHKLRSYGAITIDDSHSVARTIDDVLVVTFQRGKNFSAGALPAGAVDPAEMKKSAAANPSRRAGVNNPIESSHVGLLFFLFSLSSIMLPARGDMMRMIEHIF